MPCVICTGPTDVGLCTACAIVHLRALLGGDDLSTSDRERYQIELASLERDMLSGKL